MSEREDKAQGYTERFTVRLTPHQVEGLHNKAADLTKEKHQWITPSDVVRYAIGEFLGKTKDSEKR